MKSICRYNGSAEILILEATDEQKVDLAERLTKIRGFEAVFRPACDLKTRKYIEYLHIVSVKFGKNEKPQAFRQMFNTLSHVSSYADRETQLRVA